MVTVPPEVDVTLKQPISVCPIPLTLQLRRCYDDATTMLDAAEVRPRCQDAAFTPTAGSTEQNFHPPAGWLEALLEAFPPASVYSEAVWELRGT